MSIQLRTVSQLESIEKTLLEKGQTNYLEVSHQISDNKFVSRKCLIDDLNDVITENSELSISQKYNMIYNQNPVDISKTRQDLDDILSGNISIDGQKHFSVAPKTFYDAEYDSETIPNVELVRHIISQTGNYTHSGSYLNSNPLNTSDNGESFNGSVYDEELFQYFHLDSGTKDSSKYIVDGKQVGPLVANKTGQMIIYGWLSDDGKTAAHESWVALMMKITVGEQKQWIPIRIFPWLSDTQSKIMKYVSFDVQVREGTELKICTGFNVVGYSTGSMSGNSLLFKQGVPSGGMPNTFISYIIQNVDQED